MKHGGVVLDFSFWIMRLGMALLTILLTHFVLKGIEKTAMCTKIPYQIPNDRD